MNKLNAATVPATFFGVGFIPFAPGTFGTLAAFIIYLFLPSRLFDLNLASWYLGVLLALSALGIYICGKAEQSLGKDAPAIVWDEVCGYFVATFMLPKSLLLGIIRQRGRAARVLWQEALQPRQVSRW